tara:strand:+ start:144 stop:614 length:471 start_codon:yes stop_codon:yes gene_type:complete
MAKKEKFTMYLDQEMVEWLDLNTEDELTKSGLIRNLIRTAMKRKSRNKSISKHLDPFATSVITPDIIPDDLKDYAGLIVEWWPIRYKNKGTCSTSVANRIFKKLRSFPTQDRKQALENAIAGGWRDLFEVRRNGKPEEPKNNHPAARVFTASGGFE